MARHTGGVPFQLCINTIADAIVPWLLCQQPRMQDSQCSSNSSRQSLIAPFFMKKLELRYCKTVHVAPATALACMRWPARACLPYCLRFFRRAGQAAVRVIHGECIAAETGCPGFLESCVSSQVCVMCGKARGRCTNAAVYQHHCTGHGPMAAMPAAPNAGQSMQLKQ